LNIAMPLLADVCSGGHARGQISLCLADAGGRIAGWYDKKILDRRDADNRIGRVKK